MNRREFAKVSGAFSAIAAVPATGILACDQPEAPTEDGGSAVATQRIEILFAKGGRFVAQLNEIEAPETCKYFLERLPFTLPSRRATSSGGMVGINLEGWDLNKLEYVQTMIPEGEVGFLTTFIPHRPMNNPYCQMLLPLSGGSQAHQMWGIASPVNRMAKIIEGLDGLRAVGNRLANKGADGEDVTVRLMS